MLFLKRLIMKPIDQNLRFSIQDILLALLCFAMIPSATATEHYFSRTVADTVVGAITDSGVRAGKL